MQASPSKARAQAIESHSWSLALSWLSTVFDPLPIPAFERSAPTLKALQSLMTENIAADQLQELLFEAQCEEIATAEHDAIQLPEGESMPGSNPAPVLSLLEESLSESGKKSLESLADSAVLLGCHPSSLARGINHSLLIRTIELSRQTFDLQDHISSIEALTRHLQGQMRQTTEDLSAIRAKTTQLPNQTTENNSRPSTPPQLEANGLGTSYSHLHAQAQQHQRETQQLKLKSAEYESRIDALDRNLTATDLVSSDALSAADLVLKQQVLRDKKMRIEALEARFTEFHGLPPDIESSRKEVQRTQGELDSLKRQRDELFEQI